MGKMSTKAWALSAGLALGVGMGTGCAHATLDRTALNAPDQPYRIGQDDVLDVSVWRDPDLSRVVPVRPDGFISLPIAGEVAAAGKTPHELEEEVKAKLQPYVQTPKVTVIVHEINSSRVFVTGEVAHPGAYPLRGHVSILQAIALAGGITEFANSDGIVVVRERSDGRGGRIPVRYNDLVAAEGKDARLEAGDTVVVP